jgi:putative ABC transport system ATP-binding protein
VANDPPIILADEPTGNLDSKSGEEIIQILLKLWREGRTIAVITHDHHIASYSQRTIELLDGTIKETK